MVKIQLMPIQIPLSQIISQSRRNDVWLLSRLDYLWTNYFSDVKQANKVFIKFGRFSKLRLGSIRMDKLTKYTFITITGMFKNENIPTEVIDHTIAHELCHYTHGFSSPNPRLHKYPHHGGVILKELENRGLSKLVKAYAIWKKDYRKQLFKLHRG